MSSAANPRITLELDASADPIRGTIEHPDGTRLRFWGWLELMEELRRVAGGERIRWFSQLQPPDVVQAPDLAARPNDRDHRTTDNHL